MSRPTLLSGADVLGAGTFEQARQLDVALADGRIVETSPRRSPGTHALDLTGLTLMPGIIDAHTHLGIAEDYRQPPGTTSAAELAARIFDNLELAVEAGVTTIRELGGLDGGIQAPIARGFVSAPRVLPSGPALCQHAGAGSLVPPFAADPPTRGLVGLSQPTVMCDGPDECRRAARTAFQHGATQLKVVISGGVISHTDAITDTQFSPEELRVFVAEARARSTYVAAHAHNVDAIRMGLEAGVRCFEHVSLLDADTAGAMHAAGAAAVFTLSVVDVLLDDPAQAGLPPETQERAEGVREHMHKALRLAVDAGVQIGCGSDLIGPNQRARAAEVTRMAAALGPSAALRTATEGNARVLRLDHELGRICAGYRADLIATDGNPLEEPDLFLDPARVILVIRDGRVLKNLL